MTGICGERVGVRTQDLQIKRNLVHAITREITMGPVAKPVGATEENRDVAEGDLETAESGRTMLPSRHTAWGAQLALMRIFTRKDDGFGYRCDASAAKHLFAPIADGRIRLRITHLPLTACLEGTTMLDRSSRSESGQHMAMKRAARAWMRAGDGIDAQEEVPGYGGRFDVYSGCANWIVECGNTSIGKLMDAVLDDEPPRFTLIPWQEVLWPDETVRRLIAIDFSWTPEVTEEVADLRWAGMVRAASALEFLIPSTLTGGAV